MPSNAPRRPIVMAINLTLAFVVIFALIGGVVWNSVHKENGDQKACAEVGGQLVDGTCIDRHVILTPEH